MSRRFSSYLLIALLLLSTVAIAGVMMPAPVAAVERSAWLKIVTTSWNGQSCGIYDGISTGFAGDGVAVNTPMCPAGTGFADRFNVTNMEAFVEVYGIKPDFALMQYQGTFEPNATGFVKISWRVDPDWGLLVLVKAKSYYGERIGEGEPFAGIIMYALLIPPNNSTGVMNAEALEKIANMTGLYSLGDPGYRAILGKNFTITMTGALVDYTNYFDFSASGPFDYFNGSMVSFAKIFGNETSAGTPVN
ncbi:MAG: hypothetical protein QXK84_07135, partial [Nitrososphaerota archaeon]